MIDMTKIEFKDQLSDGKTRDQLRRELFKREFGVDWITKENVDQIIEHINSMRKVSIVRFRKDLTRHEYKEAILDNDVEMIALYEKVLGGIDSLHSGRGGLNKSEYSGHNFQGKLAIDYDYE